MARHKPGETITPASFAVAPELLGLPLASPSRRAHAMVIDLIFLAVLVKGGGIFFAVAAAFAVWRATARAGFATARPRLRKTLRLGTAAMLFLVVISNWGMLAHPFRKLAQSAADRDDGSDSVVVAREGGKVKVSGLGFAALGEAMALRNARSDAEAQRVAGKVVQRMKRSGMADEDVRDMVRGLEESKDGPLPPRALQALQAAVARELPPDSTSPAQHPDSLASAWVKAAASGDSDALEELQPRMIAAFARDTLDEMSSTVSHLKSENRKLKQRIEQDSVQDASKAVGLMDTFANAGDEIVKLLKKAGLGFGWTGLYFTAFVALMRGQTPGKKLMRIRIVRLDGRPMGWWSALERFGGYAASIVTGLSGFFQILWDKNRQAMHDKIAETVVVRL